MSISKSLWYIYTTGSGNNYPLYIEYSKVSRDEIPQDYSFFSGLCREGCKNYERSGGCPPFAPPFLELTAGYDHGLVLYARLDSRYKSEKVKNCRNYYIHYRFQDIILSNLLTHLGYRITSDLQESTCGEKVIFLNNGYCMGCSEKCSFVQGRICRSPQKRTYSLEASGVNVSEMLALHFKVNLQWYTKDNYDQVDYMIKSTAFFCREKEIRDQLSLDLVQYLNSLESTEYPVGTEKFRKKLQSFTGFVD